MAMLALNCTIILACLLRILGKTVGTSREIAHGIFDEPNASVRNLWQLFKCLCHKPVVVLLVHLCVQKRFLSVVSFGFLAWEEVFCAHQAVSSRHCQSKKFLVKNTGVKISPVLKVQ